MLQHSYIASEGLPDEGTQVSCTARTVLVNCVTDDNLRTHVSLAGVVSCLVKSQADVSTYGRYQGHHALLDAEPLIFPSKEEAGAMRRHETIK